MALEALHSDSQAVGATMNSESRKAAEKAVRDLLKALGRNPEREGLLDTPKRVVKAWEEMLEGYELKASDVLRSSGGAKGFSSTYDQMIVVSGIEFHSTCEHHLLPFKGVADVAYIPGGGRVVGLSKIPRLVDMFARRLQIQEQMTDQIANALMKELSPLGVGVRLRATHSCAECRGVRKKVNMITSRLDGAFRNPEVRQEFWELASHGQHKH